MRPQDLGALNGPHGVLGVDIASRSIDGRHWTVVQLLLDDEGAAISGTTLADDASAARAFGVVSNRIGGLDIPAVPHPDRSSS